jgi:hypothetical protein
MSVRSWLTMLIALMATLSPVTAAQSQGKRVALVIGNSAYENTPTLANPKNDADDMAAVLQTLGFEVIKGVDLKKAEMERSIRDFASALVGAEMGLFFYAGHGLQVGGVNYLVPTDAVLTTASALDFEMVRLELIQRTMESETQTNVIMLDACRDNPLSRNLARALGTRSASIGRGLGQFDAGVGTLISFSTQPGNVALDGSGRNSPYTGALVKYLATPAEDLTYVLIRVRNDVISSTASRQVPWDQHALRQPIYLSGRGAAGGPMPQAEKVPERDEIAQAWAATKDSTSIAVLQAFAERYGQTVYGEMAAARIAELQRLQEQSALQSRREYPVPPISDAAACESKGEVQYCVSSVLPTSGVNTVYYGPRNLFDEDRSTAWAEGAAGAGDREWVLLSWPAERSLRGIRLVNGYAKSSALFAKNGRVQRVRLTFSDGQSTLLAVGDGPESQMLSLASPVRARWVKIEIVAAVRGEKYNDTAISELQPVFD